MLPIGNLVLSTEICARLLIMLGKMVEGGILATLFVLVLTRRGYYVAVKRIAGILFILARIPYYNIRFLT